MTLAFERFDTVATPIDEYIEQMEENRETFFENIDRSPIDPAHLEFFKSEPVKFLILTENWCIDSAQFVPVLVKLARQAPNIDIRVLLRNEHQDLADNYRNKQGYQPIPVIIVFDRDGNELGHMLERPEQATEEMAEETRRFQDANPHLDGIKRNVKRMPEETQKVVKAHSRQWRLDQQDRFAGYLLAELREIIEAGRQARAA
jgi:thiol-disulfide isomerase/thioredoxin